MAKEFQNLRGVTKLVFWLVCLCIYNGVFREAFIDKDPKNVWPLIGDESESSFPGIFLLEVGKSIFGAALLFFGNDGILERFALNARILGAEFDYCDLKCVSRVNPNVAIEIWTPEK